jgi:prepilin-type N-terminal cleavage/methylation domain-containing protein
MQRKTNIKRLSFVKPKKSKADFGFTIIEVLIVIAIAGLILVIIFLAIRATQRNNRNLGRKNFVALTAAALDEYYTSNNSTYPDTPTQICNFLQQYLPNQTGGAIACTPTYVPVRNCVLVSLDLYDVCFHNRSVSPHVYPNNLPVVPYDEVSVQLGHWCNTDPVRFNEPDANPITNGQTSDDNVRFVVWTPLESSPTFCIDSYQRAL